MHTFEPLLFLIKQGILRSYKGEGRQSTGENQPLPGIYTQIRIKIPLQRFYPQLKTQRYLQVNHARGYPVRGDKLSHHSQTDH
jgi:hypothetical protein